MTQNDSQNPPFLKKLHDILEVHSKYYSGDWVLEHNQMGFIRDYNWDFGLKKNININSSCIFQTSQILKLHPTTKPLRVQKGQEINSPSIPPPQPNRRKMSIISKIKQKITFFNSTKYFWRTNSLSITDAKAILSIAQLSPWKLQSFTIRIKLTFILTAHNQIK